MDTGHRFDLEQRESRRVPASSIIRLAASHRTHHRALALAPRSRSNPHSPAPLSSPSTMSFFDSVRTTLNETMVKTVNLVSGPLTESRFQELGVLTPDEVHARSQTLLTHESGRLYLTPGSLYLCSLGVVCACWRPVGEQVPHVGLVRAGRSHHEAVEEIAIAMALALWLLDTHSLAWSAHMIG